MYQLVKDDVTSWWKPNEDDWRDSEKQTQAKLDKKVNDTFELMKKSSKANKLICNEFA